MIKQEQLSAAVTLLRLDHGPVSALDTELCEAVSDAVGALAARAPALVITGTGNAFSAGVDLRVVLDGGPGYLDRFLPALARVFDGVFRYPAPVVAAVNGHAIAGGCVLANCADYRMMAAGRGRIGIPELLVGVPFPVSALEVMRFATGGLGLPALAFRGAYLTPDEALAGHVVDEVVPLGELLERAVARAEALAAVPPESFRHTKAALRGPACERIDRTAAESDRRMAEIWKSPPVQAAMRRYVEQTLGARS